MYWIGYICGYFGVYVSSFCPQVQSISIHNNTFTVEKENRTHHQPTAYPKQVGKIQTLISLKRFVFAFQLQVKHTEAPKPLYPVNATVPTGTYLKPLGAHPPPTTVTKEPEATAKPSSQLTDKPQPKYDAGVLICVF